LVVGVPVGRSIAFWSGLGHATILPSCGGEGFVQQRLSMVLKNRLSELVQWNDMIEKMTYWARHGKMPLH
ncbi:hypothetical protein ACFFU8_16790, partial [Chromobacterium piscinae]|uniref:hypothetical protein n=1 Tax=Chromobacterium piscinae TaxID=686831 RepID=UPI0035EAA102